MRLHIAAVGRLRSGPERLLIDDYLERFNRSGRALGFGQVSENEVEDRRGGGRAAEAELLSRVIPKDAAVVALDERGKQLSSPEFSKQLADWRDDGRRDTIFLIGGADGLLPELRNKADLTLGFGSMVWPHMLARVMLAEQLYRAVSILAGTPYHRE